MGTHERALPLAASFRSSQDPIYVPCSIHVLEISPTRLGRDDVRRRPRQQIAKSADQPTKPAGDHRSATVLKPGVPTSSSHPTILIDLFHALI